MRVQTPVVCKSMFFIDFWAPFRVPGGALLEICSQVLAQRRSEGAIGRGDSESDFSGNDLFFGFGESLVLDVHLDCAGAFQTHN